MANKNTQPLRGRVYQLKATLNDIEPKIWRRLLVPGDFTLEELHEVLQVAMGWTNSHLHQFVVGKAHYGVPDDEFEDLKVRDEQEHTIEKVLPKKGCKIIYEYDFGDSWEHLVVVEEIHSPKGWQPIPQCLEGARRCPPEDVGSTSGYENFLTVISDPKHPEHHEMLRWAGGPFNPEEFSVDAANESLKRLHEAGSLEALWPPED